MPLEHAPSTETLFRSLQHERDREAYPVPVGPATCGTSSGTRNCCCPAGAPKQHNEG